MQMPAKSLPMMKAFDPDTDYKPNTPKDVSVSWNRKMFVESKTMTHFVNIFFRQAEKKAEVSVETQVKDLLQVGQTLSTSCVWSHGDTVFGLTSPHVFSWRTSRCPSSTAPSSPTCAP